MPSISLQNAFFVRLPGAKKLQPRVLQLAVAEFLVKERFTLALWKLIVKDWLRTGESWVKICMDVLARSHWTNLVLFDIASGGIKHLPRSRDQAILMGTDITPDLSSRENACSTGLSKSADRLAD